jgi:hypothetical protein
MGKREKDVGKGREGYSTVYSREKGMQRQSVQHTVYNVSTVVYLQGTVLYCTVGTMRRTVYSIHRER